MIPSGYRNSQLQLQPEFPRSQEPGITAHSMGKRWAQTLLSNEKEVGRDKSSFFSPLNTGQQLSSSSKMEHSHTSLQFHPPAVPSHTTFYFVFRVSPISSVNFTNLTESNCPIPKHFFLPMKTLQRYTSVHKKLIQLHNNHFLDIIFETSIS